MSDREETEDQADALAGAVAALQSAEESRESAKDALQRMRNAMEQGLGLKHLSAETRQTFAKMFDAEFRRHLDRMW